MLQRFAEKILGAKEELALLETLDMGKPIQYSLAVDVPACARCIAWYAEAVDKVYDEIAPTAASALALITREPMGVVGVIVPWNYPMIMAAWKLGPALAAGNSVVLKPSEKSPLSALRLAELEDQPLIFYRQVNGSGIAALLEAACREAGFSPRIVEETPRIISTLQMVAAGFGLAVVPQSMQAFRNDQIIYRELAGSDDITVPLILAYRRQVDAEALRRFLALSLSDDPAAYAA